MLEFEAGIFCETGKSPDILLEGISLSRWLSFTKCSSTQERYPLMIFQGIGGCRRNLSIDRGVKVREVNLLNALVIKDLSGAGDSSACLVAEGR